MFLCFITDLIPNEVRIFENETLSLTCSIFDEVYENLYDEYGEKFYSGKMYFTHFTHASDSRIDEKYVKKLNVTTKLLEIPNIRTEDSGTYYCYTEPNRNQVKTNMICLTEVLVGCEFFLYFFYFFFNFLTPKMCNLFFSF